MLKAKTAQYSGRDTSAIGLSSDCESGWMCLCCIRACYFVSVQSVRVTLPSSIQQPLRPSPGNVHTLLLDSSQLHTHCSAFCHTGNCQQQNSSSLKLLCHKSFFSFPVESTVFSPCWLDGKDTSYHSVMWFGWYCWPVTSLFYLNTSFAATCWHTAYFTNNILTRKRTLIPEI